VQVIFNQAGVGAQTSVASRD